MISRSVTGGKNAGSFRLHNKSCKSFNLYNKFTPLIREYIIKVRQSDEVKGHVTLRSHFPSYYMVLFPRSFLFFLLLFCNISLFLSSYFYHSIPQEQLYNSIKTFILGIYCTHSRLWRHVTTGHEKNVSIINQCKNSTSEEWTVKEKEKINHSRFRLTSSPVLPARTDAMWAPVESQWVWKPKSAPQSGVWFRLTRMSWWCVWWRERRKRYPIRWMHSVRKREISRVLVLTVLFTQTLSMGLMYNV